jgi:exosortase
MSMSDEAVRPNDTAADESLQADKKPGAGASLVSAALIAAACLAALAWAYWPTASQMVAAWEREPDYSHGFLVPPLAALMLWTRRKEFPGLANKAFILGLASLAVWFALRVVAGFLFIDAVDGWSFLVWCVAFALLIGGRPLLAWCWPAIAFLFFMIPLPYKTERMLSLPLQTVAAKASTWVLQLFGQPALREGNTIILGEQVLEVEEACSGLRIFVGIVALGFAYAILMRKTWWETALMLVASVPVAIVANVTRIVGTGLLYQITSAHEAREIAHDFAGWAMIPFALLLLGAFVWYLNRLLPKVPVADVRQALVRKGAATQG